MGLLDNSLVALVLRVVQAVFAIIVLGLSAYVAHWWSSYWNAGSPGEVRFLIFCAVWTLFALIVLVIIPFLYSEVFKSGWRRFVILGFEAITMIFWFAGFIALAAFIGHRGCFGGVCSAAKAAAVFGAFEWIAFTLTTILSVLHARGSSNIGGTHHKDPSLNVQGAD